jgi:PAS domain S-box-containing protein
MKNVVGTFTNRSPGLMIGVAGILLASIAMVVLTVTVALDRAEQSRLVDGLVGHSEQVIDAAGAALASAEDTETGQRGFLLTNDAKYLEPYDNGVASGPRNLAALGRLAADNPAQQQRLERWESLFRAKLAVIAETIALARAGDSVGATDIERSSIGKVLMDEMRKVAAEMVDEEQDLLRRHRPREQELERWTTGILAGLLIIAASGILLCGAMASRLLLGNAAKVRAAMDAAELRESEARLRLLADHVSQFVWIADKVGSIQWLNQRWYDYTGSTFEEMQGAGWWSVHHPDHVARVTRRIQHAIWTGLPWEDTFPLRGRDGQYRWFLSRALPVRSALGVIDRWFGTHTDVTDQHAANDVLTRSQEELERQVKQHAVALTHEMSEHRDAEIALRESAEHTRLALSAVNSIGTYDWDIVTGQVYANAPFAQIFDMARACGGRCAASGLPCQRAR